MRILITLLTVSSSMGATTVPIGTGFGVVAVEDGAAAAIMFLFFLGYLRCEHSCNRLEPVLVTPATLTRVRHDPGIRS